MSTPQQDRDAVEAAKHLRRLNRLADRELEYEGRHASLIPAGGDQPRRSRALWADEKGRGTIMALGEISLLNGPGGLGKSALMAWIAARVTRGELNGEYFGIPKSVIMDMREDDWHSVTVPRLIAAGADMSRVFRAHVRDTIDGTDALPAFPADARQMAYLGSLNDVALYCIDPMPSTMSDGLNPDKTQHVRKAFQPLMFAGRSVGMSVLGICHNKKGATDPTEAISGSTAFRDLARAVLTVTHNPGDEADGKKMFGLTKNNYGPDDLPARYYDTQMVSVTGAQPFEHIPTITIAMGAEARCSIKDAMEQNAGTESDRHDAKDCAGWLEAYLKAQPGREASLANVLKHGAADGYSKDQLKRAKRALGVEHERSGFSKDMTTTWRWVAP